MVRASLSLVMSGLVVAFGLFHEMPRVALGKNLPAICNGRACWRLARTIGRANRVTLSIRRAGGHRLRPARLQQITGDLTR